MWCSVLKTGSAHTYLPMTQGSCFLMHAVRILIFCEMDIPSIESPEERQFLPASKSFQETKIVWHAKKDTTTLRKKPRSFFGFALLAANPTFGMLLSKHHLLWMGSLQVTGILEFENFETVSCVRHTAVTRVNSCNATRNDCMLQYRDRQDCTRFLCVSM